MQVIIDKNEVKLTPEVIKNLQTSFSFIHGRKFSYQVEGGETLFKDISLNTLVRAVREQAPFVHNAKELIKIHHALKSIKNQGYQCCKGTLYKKSPLTTLLTIIKHIFASIFREIALMKFNSEITKITKDLTKTEILYHHLNAASEVFEAFNRVPVDKQENAFFRDHLETAYQALCKLFIENEPLLDHPRVLNAASRLFYLLGRYEYPGHIEKARHYFQASLLIKIYALDLRENPLNNILCYSTTDEFQESLQSQNALQNLSENPEMDLSPFIDLPEKILNNILENDVLNQSKLERLYDLSCNLRWLGHACQNIDSLNKDVNRFKIIYDLAEKCNQRVIQESQVQKLADKAQIERVELSYNTDRFLYEFEHPQDPLGKMQCLDKVKEHLDEFEKMGDEKHILWIQTKRAQIENIIALELNNLGGNDMEQLNKMLEHSFKSVGISNSEPDFDPHLKIMFFNNYLHLSLEVQKKNAENLPGIQNPFSLDELTLLVQEILQKAQELPNYYNAFYYIGAAKLAHYKEDHAEALRLLDEAEAIANSSPENATDSLNSIKKLRESISLK